MKSLLTVENQDNRVRTIGTYSTQDALDSAIAFFNSSLQEGEYFAITPLDPNAEIEEERTYMSALEMAELDYDNEYRDY